MARRSLPRSTRLAIAGAVTAALLVAAGITVWRVLRPSEVVTPATTAYPIAPALAPGRVGALVSAPLIVDDRVRVFAKKREVWSDGPPNYHYEKSAYWSYRRWPAQVVAIVVTNAPDPIVVTSWTDGMLVAIDARTGNVAWRIQGDEIGDEYTGRRTGASTVYPETGLFTSNATIITTNSKTIRGYRPEGAQIWQTLTPVAGECRGPEFTTQTQYVVLDTCAKTLKRIDTATGAALPDLGSAIASAEPISCVVGHSNCPGVRTPAKAWLLDGPTPTESATLTKPGSLLTNALAIVPAVNEITAHHPETGALVWTYPLTTPTQLVAATEDRVFLLTADHTLVALDPKTGAHLTIAGLNMPQDPFPASYSLSHKYATHHYVALERTVPDVSPTAKDDTYYFTNRPILIAIG